MINCCTVAPSIQVACCCLLIGKQRQCKQSAPTFGPRPVRDRPGCHPGLCGPRETPPCRTATCWIGSIGSAREHHEKHLSTHRQLDMVERHVIADLPNVIPTVTSRTWNRMIGRCSCTCKQVQAYLRPGTREKPGRKPNSESLGAR